MKVLNVNMALDAFSGGGTAERTFQISRFLAAKHIHCTVLALDLGKTSIIAAQALSNVHVILLPCLSKRFYIPLISLKKLTAIVADADIIHLIGHWTVLNALIYYLARKLHKPYVFCPAGALPIFGRSKILKKLYNGWVGRKIVQNAAKCIAIAEVEFPAFQSYGISKDRITVIPNGICMQDYISSQEEAALLQAKKSSINLAGYKYILFVGRLNYIKGPDLLLTAFKNIADKFTDIHLVYAGPDEGLLTSLQDQANAHQLQKRVHFLGNISGQDKLVAFQQALLLAIPSRSEVMSIVVLEAAASGVPALLTDRCGFNQIMEVNGGLVVEASAESIEEGLTKLLTNQGQLNAKGSNLKNYVANNYTWDVLVDKFIDCYRNILNINKVEEIL